VHGGPQGLNQNLHSLYRAGLGQFFQLLKRGLVNVFFPRGFGHSRLIHFFFDAGKRRLIRFLPGLSSLIMHPCTISRVQKGLPVNLEQLLAVLEIVFKPCGFEQSASVRGT
jgi:hypothetical protein